ncbi:MAG: PhzF family phenazine biosynthesis protein [Acidobacteriota bacterium]|nr:PhzF family phenazine biosynthesis protein [Acidobacteriota bacterium]
MEVYVKKYPLYQVDAFTSKVFGGNPAGVMLLESWMTDERMQRIAAENNLSETAFLVPQEGVWGLRWFTPAAEVDLCGHATLAAAHVLYKLNKAEGEIQFITQSGTLRVSKGPNELLTMNFPSRPPHHVDMSLEEAEEALGVRPVEVLTSRDLLVVFKDEKDVRQLHPDFGRIAKLDNLGVIATAPGEKCDFVSRFFCPRVGILEDPVTGSAHCTLTPFWAERLGKSKLHAMQLSERVGELFCTNLDDRVLISGNAVIYMYGAVLLDS